MRTIRYISALDYLRKDKYDTHFEGMYLDLESQYFSPWNSQVHVVDTLTMLMDNGYPKLRKLDLQSCGIGDDLIEMISPALSKNESLRYFILHNHRRGERNMIGERGVAALSNAVHNSSSFEKTLGSNHTIWKIVTDTSGVLFRVCVPNLSGESRYRTAWKKHIIHLVENKGADMSPFMDLDIKLLPQFLSQIKELSSGYHHNALSAYYKIWSCKMFRDRIEMASRIGNLQAKNVRLNAKVEELEGAKERDNERNEQLEDENSQLKEQIAKLMAQNPKPRSKSKKPETVAGSIAERVKGRSNTRKRGRKEIA